MKKYVTAAKESTNGVFWYIDDQDKLLSYPFGSVDTVSGIAKSGDTYNHKRLWAEIRPNKKPYNYYPRGRVDWDNQGRATIYLNPNITDDSIINQIRVDFGIRHSDEYRIEYDYSNHYKSHLDTGWKEEK